MLGLLFLPLILCPMLAPSCHALNITDVVIVDLASALNVVFERDALISAAVTADSCTQFNASRPFASNAS